MKKYKQSVELVFGSRVDPYGDNFNDALNKAIKNIQEKDLIVEVQYHPMFNDQGLLRTALILGYKDEE